MKIHISETTREELRLYPYKVEYRGEIEVKVHHFLLEMSILCRLSVFYSYFLFFFYSSEIYIYVCMSLHFQHN